MKMISQPVLDHCLKQLRSWLTMMIIIISKNEDDNDFNDFSTCFRSLSETIKIIVDNDDNYYFKKRR